MERQLKVPQGRTLGRASESPGMDSLARSWRSSPWLQQLQGSLEHAPAASACSAECCALPAARRSRAVDIVDIFLQRIDGNRKRLEEASGSARASTGCNHRPSGTSGGPCGPAGAIGGVCACVPGVGPGGSFTALRMSILYALRPRAAREPGYLSRRPLTLGVRDIVQQQPSVCSVLHSSPRDALHSAASACRRRACAA